MIYIQPLLYLSEPETPPFSLFQIFHPRSPNLSSSSFSLRLAKIVNRVDEPSPVIFETEGKKRKRGGGGKKWNNNSVYAYTLSAREILIAPLSN